MLDCTKKEESDALDLLRGYATSLCGYNFALAMREDDRITVYPRENQPCQGGEMRKYGKRSPNRSKDSRPGDLKHPFPEGIVEAVSIHYNRGFDPEFIEFVTSKESPYRRGVGEVEHILKDDKIIGSVFLDTEVDPTVFVNLLQFIKSQTYDGSLFKRYVEKGLSESEAILCMMMWQNDPSLYFGSVNDYYFPVHASVRRILEGDPHDLTGGTYRDGYDYNRPEIQDLFKAGEGEVSTVWAQEVEERGGAVRSVTPCLNPDGTEYMNPRTGKPYMHKSFKAESFEKYCEVAKELIRDALAGKGTEIHTIKMEDAA